MKHLTFLYDKGGETIALQHLLSVRRFQIQMTVSLQRHAASARRAAEKADLHEIRLVNVQQRDGFLADGRRQRLDANRPPP